MRIGRPIRESFNTGVSRMLVKPVERGVLTQAFRDTLSHRQGVAVSEQWHGKYSFPLFMRDMIPVFKEMNATRFFTEVVRADKQSLVDAWQEGRDEESFPNHLDSNHFAYSKYMWQHYWQMFCGLRDEGIKIVGLDNPDIQSGYGAVFDAPFKTMFWHKVIEEDLATMGPGERFIVQGGELHMAELGNPFLGIHQMLDIPRVLLETGKEYGMGCLIFDKIPESCIIRIPDVSYQDNPSAGARDVRSVPVRYPLPGKGPL
jgi:hypothetical protein